jgi:hypothetical protein
VLHVRPNGCATGPAPKPGQELQFRRAAESATPRLKAVVLTGAEPGRVGPSRKTHEARSAAGFTPAVTASSLHAVTSSIHRARLSRIASLRARLSPMIAFPLAAAASVPP